MDNHEELSTDAKGSTDKLNNYSVDADILMQKKTDCYIRFSKSQKHLGNQV